MKIMAINGSLDGNQGATFPMIESFLQGAREAGAERAEQIVLAGKNIHGCRGCFSCWIKTPGRCIRPDDLEDLVYPQTAGSDLVIYASSLNQHNISSLLLRYMERHVGSALPSIKEDPEHEAVHPLRSPERRAKMMVMADCTEAGQSHFDVLRLLFQRRVSLAQTELVASIYRDQSSLLLQSSSSTDRYQATLREAGREIVRDLQLSPQTQAELERPLATFQESTPSIPRPIDAAFQTIVAINGSPRGKRSTSHLMIEELFQGIRAKAKELDRSIKLHEIVLAETPATDSIAQCDLAIFATPIYVDNMTSLLQEFLERTAEVFTKYHPPIVFLSNCGFPGQHHFDVPRRIFRKFAQDRQTQLIAEICRDEGPLLSGHSAVPPAVATRIQAYRSQLRNAGEELIQHAALTQQTAQLLHEPLMPMDAYIAFHNARLAALSK